MPLYQASVKLQDAFGRVSTRRYVIDEVGYAEASAAMANFVVDLAALTEAEILEYSVAFVTTYSDSVEAGANLDEGITLTLLKEDNRKASIKVPAPDTSVCNPDGTVDITNALVTNYTDNFTSGTFLVSDGEVATDLLSGKLDR